MRTLHRTAVTFLTLCLVSTVLSGCIHFKTSVAAAPQSDDYSPPDWKGRKVPAVVEYKLPWGDSDRSWAEHFKYKMTGALRDAELFSSVETVPPSDPNQPYVRLAIEYTINAPSCSVLFFDCSLPQQYLSWLTILPFVFPMGTADQEPKLIVSTRNWDNSEKTYSAVTKYTAHWNGITLLMGQLTGPWGDYWQYKHLRTALFNQMRRDDEFLALAPGAEPAKVMAAVRARAAERQRVEQEQRRLAEERAAEAERKRAEEQQKAAEAQREAERQRLAEERQRTENEKRQQAEARARQKAEEQRLAEERKRQELAIATKPTTLSPDQRGVSIEGQAPASYVLSQYSKAWAVVIGINQYRKNIPKLHYAVADAKAVGDLLEAQGFSVIRLYDDQATREHILGVLGDELPMKVKPNDRVTIFWAGHGETRTIEGAQQMGYLLPVDANRNQLHRTSINMGEIRQLAALLPAKHVLFVVDTCYGGIAGHQFRSLPEHTASYLKQVTRERGRQLITAGGPGQQVVEGPQWGHSAFTYYLLEGLKGLADLNDDGIIPASELYAYLDGRVPTAAEGQQRPEMWSLAAEKGEFVFIPSRKIKR